MQLRRLSLALVALAISATSLPALAVEGDADGCRDIIAAKVDYDANKYYDHGLTPLELDDEWVYTGGGVVRVRQMTLAAPACRNVDYTVYIYRETLDDGQPVLLGARDLTGEGPRPSELRYDSSTDVDDPIPGDYTERCVRVVLETASRRDGTVFDRAQDASDDINEAYARVCVPDDARTWN